MSGKKSSFISLSQEQYQALHDNFIKRLFFGGDDEKNNAGEADFQNRMINNQQQTEDRQSAFIDLASHLNQQIKDIEIQSSAAVVQSEEKLMRQMLAQTGDAENRLANMLDTHLQSYNEQILEQHHQQQNQITRLRRQMLNMTQNDEARASLAAEWLENSREMIEFIDKHYPHRQFTPAKLDALMEDFQLALQNYEMGLYEAALVAAQNIYRRSSDLRLVLEREERQWRTCYALVQKEAQDLIAQFDERSLFKYQPEGTDKTYPVDINYWSKGDWNENGQKLTALIQQLKQNAGQLSVQDLRLYLNETLPQWRKKQQNIFDDAVKNLVDSQIRTNIADLVMKALQKQGYELDTSNFEGDDSRQGFHFIAENISGNAVSVLINPTAAEKNEIQLESIDKKPQTEHFLKQRAQEIAVSLRKFGLSMDEFMQKAAGGYELGRQGRLVAEEKTRYAVH